MRSWLLVLAVAGAVAAHGTTTFERTFGGPDFDRGVFVTPARDGGYLAVGATRSTGAGDEDVYLVKTDAKGELQWSRTYGGLAEDNGWSVHETPDGIVLAGFTKSFGAGGYDFYLVKTDPEGEPQWSRTYGGEGDERCWALVLTPDGGFALAGETTSVGAGEEDWFLVVTDAAGEELWSRAYGGEKGDRCFAISLAADGFMLAGQTYSEGAGDRDAQVIKVGAEGEREWSRTFGGADSDVAHSIVRTTGGDHVVTGYTTSLAAEDDDPYLIRIDERGEILWTRVLALEGVNHTLTGAQASDGGFYLVGFSEYPARGANAALLVKTDPGGRLAWHRDLLLTDDGRSLGYTVRATGDGGCVFTGHTTTRGDGGFDLLLVKIPEPGR